MRISQVDAGFARRAPEMLRISNRTLAVAHKRQRQPTDVQNTKTK